MQAVLRLTPALEYGAVRALRNLTFALFLAAPALAEPLEVVALGDSLTQGYGLSREDGFVPQLEAWLRAQGRDVTVVNAGVSGDTTAGGLARLDWSLTPDTDAIIVTLGGNDLLRGIDPATSRANLDAILREVSARGLPAMLVGLQAPANYGPDFQRDFDAMYPDLAASYGAVFVRNFFTGMRLKGTDPAVLQTYMQPDGIHPSAAGVAEIVATLGPQVLSLLDRARQ